MAHSSSGIAGFSRHALFAGVAALALPVAAHAQDNAPAGQSDNGEDVETAEELEQALGGNTIVVTATKREETLQEAPGSARRDPRPYRRADGHPVAARQPVAELFHHHLHHSWFR